MKSFTQHIFSTLFYPSFLKRQKLSFKLTACLLLANIAFATVTNAQNTITLTSAVGTNNQTVCINTPITNITYATTGATNATVTGLPAGVSGSWATDVVTISGTPTATGTFNYTVTLTGGSFTGSATGTITVTPANTVGTASSTPTLCINTALTAITHTTTGATAIGTATGLPAGVTAAWSGNTITINGTPTATGTFNYSIPLTGGCGSVNATGTITVTANASLILTSGSTSNTQNFCINTALSNITYSLTGGATGATVSSLPPGVTANYSAGQLTISGTPTSSGTFNYTVNTSGTCVQATASGTITVTANAAINLSSGPGSNNQTICINNAITNIIYNITGGATNANVTGLPTGITANFSGGVLTISGTATVAGSSNYTVTTTGTCIQASANGTINVTANAGLNLTSGPTSNTQNFCINTALTNITYSLTGGATNATVINLPPGVTANYSAGQLTISGTPTSSGTFNYTVNTTGTCVQATASGTITVTANAAINLTSGPGTNNQTICINTAVSNISYVISGGATSASVTGLPSGLSGTFSGNTLTISGTATSSGTSTYTVNTTGTCVQATVSGTITVTANAAIVLTSGTGTNAQSLCTNTAISAITYSITGGATNATVSSLPPGVTANYSAGQLTISGTPSSSGTFNYTVNTTGTCVQATATGTITVTNNSLPATVGAIAGISPACQGTNQTYSISPVTNATSYLWAIPSGWTLNSGQGTTSISVLVGTAGGSVNINAINTCGTTTNSRIINVTLNDGLTLTSGSSSNNQTFCINTALTPITYSITGGATNASVNNLPPGVTANYSAGQLTISGTPSSSGTFNYTVNTTGTCVQATASGTIQVNPNSNLSLTSGAGSNNQTICINNAITNISYVVSGGATSASVTGLPSGISGTFSGSTLTISGTPTIAGTFNYQVNSSGTCLQATTSGTITVTANAAIVLTSGTGSNAQSLCINTAISVITYSITGGATNATVTGLPAGVTGSYNSGVFTISGSPTAAGTSNYTITTTGTCIQTTTSGTIQVNPNSNLSLTSGAGSNNQTICINNAITNISYVVSGGATSASVTGLPSGISGTFSGSTLIISGNATISGTFNFSVFTIGTCIQSTATGTIVVNANAAINLTSGSGTNNQTICINNAITSITYLVTGGATNATVTGLPAGVTASYSAGELTISGTPTSSGISNFSITTTGTCIQTTATGTIQVNLNSNMSLTSGTGSNNQTICINNAITNIRYSVTGGATNASVNGLPTGVTANFSAGVLTISGTPTIAGTFNYQVSTSGTCLQTTASGTITVTANASLNLTSGAGTNTQDICFNTALTTITYSLTGGATNANVTGLPSGVTASYNAGELTISGTPTSLGTFNFSITTTGTCIQTTATGTIQVNPNSNISLTSGAGSNNQTICINNAITNIRYSVTGGATNASVNGLPTGVTANFSAGVLTISGTATVAGSFDYTVTTIGTCIQTNATGSIKVTANASLILTSGTGTNTQDICINTALTTITYSLTGGATNANVTGLPSGVTASYNAGELTISGTPSSSGTFNFSITTTGTCIQTTTTGTIQVNPNSNMSLTSGAGSNNQTICINNAITNIRYSITGGATNANVTGLPTGITANFTGGVLTISGTATVAGSFDYTVTTIGTCIQTNATGTINVTANATLNLTSGSGTNDQIICINTALTKITYSISGGATNANVIGLPAGVTSSFNAGELSISGTPTNSGNFNFTITTTGTCIQTTATGTIQVNPNSNLSLTSGTGSNNQTICINTAISTISYVISGGASSASVTGLPAGISGSLLGNTFSISGNATVSGTFNYTVSTSGTCIQSTATGTIVVNANASLSLTSGTGTDNQTLCLNSAINNITYLAAGGATNAIVSGLPAGVTGSFNSGVLTISGSPTVAGTFNYTVSTTGNCIQTNATGTIGVNTFPPVGNPTPITGNPPTCQLTNGTTSTTFATTAANNQGFIWTINNPAAGIIDSASGVMTWMDAFSGTVNIQVSAKGCNNTTTQVVRPVTITPTVGTPTAITVSSGTEPTCQVSNSSTLTIYRTTATDNTGFAWSVSNFAAGNINPSSGVMTWNNGFSGTVDIQVTANGCNGPSVQVIRTVNVTPANFTVTNTPLIQAICAGSSSSLVALSSNVANTTYTWSTSATFGVTGYTSTGTDTIPVQTINSLGNKIDSVTYFITPTANGCVGPVTRYIISILPKPKVSMLVSPTKSCAPAVITFNNTSKFANKWEWYINGSLFSMDSMPNPRVITDTGSHVITLVASNTLGCGIDSISRTVLVTKAPRLPMTYPRINAVKGIPTQLSAAPGGLIYSWKPSIGLDNPNIKNPIGFYNTLLDSVIYFITITDSAGCVITDKQVVWVYAKPGINMPTAFTPNGDGVNDLFKPVVSSNIRVKFLRIFDRWGKLIFETIDINYGWDGTINGKPMPMSTYTWVISGIDTYGNELLQKGNVTLIRN